MSNNNLLVSCIIIFLNTEAFLQEAIDSVLAQTYDNWELLLVDDGSTDSSTAIAQSYASQYPDKIQYLDHEGHQNRGMSATRNLGIQHAKGEYIAFLDADDVWVANTLTEQVNLLQAHPEAAMVYGPIQWWYSWTNHPEDLNRDYTDTPGVFLENPDAYLNRVVQPPILASLLLQRQISIAGMLISRQALESVGRFNNAFRTLYEDQVFCIKICLKYPVLPVSQCWYKYRQHPQGSCIVAEKTKTEDAARLAFLNWLEQYLIEQNLKQSSFWDTVQQELFPYRYPRLTKLRNRGAGLKERLQAKGKSLIRQTFLASPNS